MNIKSLLIACGLLISNFSFSDTGSYQPCGKISTSVTYQSEQPTISSYGICGLNHIISTRKFYYSYVVLDYNQYYFNTDGLAIHSPSYCPFYGIPTGICEDGTYTYSTHHNGAGSYHGGVYEWLDRD